MDESDNKAPDEADDVAHEGCVINLPPSGSGFKALFCPVSLINALIKLGKKLKSSISPRSHKCEFRFNPETMLTEFNVRTNTYARMAKRSWRNEPASALLLKECIVPLVLGLELAATYPQFMDNYQTIRDGLYALMICYSHDKEVQQIIAALLDCMPRDLKRQPLPKL